MDQMFYPWMDHDFWECGIGIKQKNCAKAAKALRDAGLSGIVGKASSKHVIQNALYTTIEHIEPVLRVIAQFVEPGSELVYLDFGRENVRYYFNGNSIERWTKPRIVYTKKEVI